MDNLPIELYEKISDDLSLKELFNFIFTCKKNMV